MGLTPVAGVGILDSQCFGETSLSNAVSAWQGIRNYAANDGQYLICVTFQPGCPAHLGPICRAVARSTTGNTRERIR